MKLFYRQIKQEKGCKDYFYFYICQWFCVTKPKISVIKRTYCRFIVNVFK